MQRLEQHPVAETHHPGLLLVRLGRGQIGGQLHARQHSGRKPPRVPSVHNQRDRGTAQAAVPSTSLLKRSKPHNYFIERPIE